MTIDFIKMYTGKNDFILIDTANTNLIPKDSLVLAAKKLCNRSRGIGANGLIYLTKENGNIRSLFYSSNGTLSENSFDAYYCIARYFFDMGFFNKGSFTFLNSANKTIHAEYIDSSNFRINLGQALDQYGTILSNDPNMDYNDHIIINNHSIYGSIIQFFRKDFVFFLSEDSNENYLQTLYEKLFQTHSEIFPVFAKYLDRETARYYNFHKDLQCDWAHTAASIALGALLNGFTEDLINVDIDAQLYFIEWNSKKHDVSLTTSSYYAFRGDIEFGDDTL